MKVELTLATSEVVVADFMYCGRGVSRDVLLSEGVVFPFGAGMASKICRANKANNGVECRVLLTMKSAHVPRAYGYITSQMISDMEYSILIAEAVPMSIDHQLAEMKDVEPCAVAAVFIEDILRKGLLWLVGSWVGSGD